MNFVPKPPRIINKESPGPIYAFAVNAALGRAKDVLKTISIYSGCPPLLAGLGLTPFDLMATLGIPAW